MGLCVSSYIYHKESTILNGGNYTHRRLRLPKVPKYLPQVPKKRISLAVIIPYMDGMGYNFLWVALSYGRKRRFPDFADLCDGSRRQGFFLEDIEEVVDFQTQILSATVVTVTIYNWLVDSTHKKNMSQNGNLPQIGVNIKNIKKYLKPPPR